MFRKGLKKMCAVCGDICETNVIYKFHRFRDNKLFHVCAYCRETNAFKDAEELTEYRDNNYITYTYPVRKKFVRA